MAEEDKTVTKPLIKGHFDSISGLYVAGWAFNEEKPDERLKVSVVVDGSEVAHGVADQFRQDLLDAKIGDGKHSFVISLPESIIDEKEHEIRVFVKGYDIELPNSPKRQRFLYSSLYFSVEIEGLSDFFITGKAAYLSESNKALKILVYEDNTLLAQGFTNPSEGGRFSIPLPPDVLDGNIHIFRIEEAEKGLTLGYCVDITPYYLTPYDALQKYSKELYETQSPIARLRYETISKSLSKIATEPEKVVHNLNILHGILTGKIKISKDIEKLPILEFPPVISPDISIIIPVHNKFDYTYKCLASILFSSYANESSFEVIVVDDCSEDLTTELPKIARNIKYIRNEINLGFLKSCNKGAQHADGKYVLFLNNDTEVYGNWVDEMHYVFENFDNVGLVGAKLIYPDGKLQEAGGIVWGNGSPWNYGRLKNPADPRYNYIREVDYCSGACIMVPKDLWDRIGGFDEDYSPAYYEDTDLAFKIRKEGYKTMYTPFAQIVHYEGISCGTDVNTGIKQYQKINEVKFKNKWISYFSKDYAKPSSDVVDIVKDRNIYYRILFVDYQLPMPDKEGGGYASFEEIKLLRSLGFKVTFIPDNMAYLSGYVEELQRLGVEVIYTPFYLSVEEFIRKRGKEFDAFFIVRWYIARKYVDLIKSVNPDAKILLNLADLHFLRELREAVATKNKEMLNNAIRTREAELEILRRVDLALSYNEIEESVILSHNPDSTKVAKCPWVVYPVDKIAPFDERKDIAFLGNYRHFPNISAVKFFASEVMPKLTKILPDVKFLIYGSNVTEEIEELESENVIVKGFIEDLSKLFQNCKIFVAPLLSGAGIKGKVLNALVYGVPSVLSPVAAEGTGIRNGLEAIVAEDVDEWVDAIYKLYKDKDLWQKLSKNAIEFVRNEYSFERGRLTMKKAFEKVGIVLPLEYKWFRRV